RGGAHHRRNELPAHRCRRLDAGGEGRLISGARHHRNRDAARRDGIGDRAAVDRPEQPADDDGDLAGSALGRASDGQTEVLEESEQTAPRHHRPKATTTKMYAADTSAAIPT